MASKQFGTLGTAGGHKSMARAEIHSENLKNQVTGQDRQAVQKWIIEKISSFLAERTRTE
ncbi:MAG: hypothetical protein ACOC0W_08255 [Desulfosalsimonas sp.]